MYYQCTTFSFKQQVFDCENKCKFFICILDLPFNISLNNCLQTFSSPFQLKVMNVFKIEELWEENEKLSLRD